MITRSFRRLNINVTDFLKTGFKDKRFVKGIDKDDEYGISKDIDIRMRDHLCCIGIVNVMRNHFYPECKMDWIRSRFLYLVVRE